MSPPLFQKFQKFFFGEQRIKIAGGTRGDLRPPFSLGGVVKMSHSYETYQPDEDLGFQIGEAVHCFGYDVSQVCTSHLSAAGNEVYAKRTEQIRLLSELADDIENMARQLRELISVVGILPSRELEGQLKTFARTRTFRLMGRFLHETAEAVEGLEDNWNDMVPFAPSTSSVASLPSSPLPAPAVELNNTRRKGPA